MAIAIVKSLEAKAVSVFWPGEAPYQNWGGGTHFTRADAGRDSGWTTSALITAALRWKCEQFNQASFCVKRLEYRGEAGKKRRVELIIEDHDMIDLLRHPCGITRGSMTRSEFQTCMLISYEVHGNAYALRLRHAGGYTNRLQYLPHWLVRPVKQPGSPNDVDYYEYTRPDGVERLDPSRIVHWKQGMDPRWDFLGFSPLKAVLSQRATEKELAAMTVYLLKNLGIGARLITPKTPEEATLWTGDTIKNIKKELNLTRQGGFGSDPVFSTAVDVFELNATLDKFAPDKINQIPMMSILSVLNVDPAVIPAFLIYYSDSKGADVKAKNEMAYKSSIFPPLNSYSQRMTLDVMGDFGDIRTDRVDKDVRDVWALAEDQNKLYERSDKSFLAGRLTLNEARELTGQDEDDEFGDLYYTQFPQQFAVGTDHAPTLQNGTNGIPANQPPRASRQTEDVSQKAWRKAMILGRPPFVRPAVNPYPPTAHQSYTSDDS